MKHPLSRFASSPSLASLRNAGRRTHPLARQSGFHGCCGFDCASFLSSTLDDRWGLNA